MAKARTHYICRTCGAVQTQWMGKCPDCGAWDALEKFTEAKAPKEAHSGLAESWKSENDSGPAIAVASAVAALPLPEIQTTDTPRMPTGVGELDRVLGGGLVPGSVVLLGGDPGIGKSTLMLQAAGHMARDEQRVLYVTSEESAFQTRLRAERLFSNDGIAIKRAKPSLGAASGAGGGRGGSINSMNCLSWRTPIWLASSSKPERSSRA